MRERIQVAPAVWALTTLFIALAAAAPYNFDISLHSVLEHVARVRLNPLISPDTGRRISIADFIQNVLLFVPFGAAAMFTLRGRARRRIVRVVSMGCALSLAVECVQLLTTHRISSLADVLGNTIGTFVGAITATGWSRPQAQRFVRAASTSAAAVPSYYPALAAALLVCVTSWQPFDVTLDVTIVRGHLKAFLSSAWQWPVSAGDIAAFAQFLLFGFMLVQWLRDLHVRFPVSAAIWTSVTVGVALENSQIFIESRLPTVAGALANAAGGLAGTLLSAIDMGAPSKMRILTVACFGVAVIATINTAATFPPASPMLRPLDVVMRWVPFGLAFGYARVFSTRSALSATLTALTLAAVVEWLFGRETGSSPVLNLGCCAVGAFVGAWIAVSTRGTPQPTR